MTVTTGVTAPNQKGTTMAGATRKTAAKKAAAPTPTEAEKKEKEELQRKRREAYGAAESRLREEQKDRFRQLVEEEAQQRGITYQFKKSPKEKAKDAIAAILAEHPELAEELARQQAVSEGGTVPVVVKDEAGDLDVRPA